MGNEFGMDIASLGQTYLGYRQTRWNVVNHLDDQRRLDQVEQTKDQRQRILGIVSEAVDPLIMKISSVDGDEAVFLYFVQKYLSEFLSEDQHSALREYGEELDGKFHILGELKSFIRLLQATLTQFFDSSGQLFQQKDHTVSLQLPGGSKGVREFVGIECQRILLDLTQHASSNVTKPEFRFTINDSSNTLELNMKK